MIDLVAKNKLDLVVGLVNPNIITFEAAISVHYTEYNYYMAAQCSHITLSSLVVSH